MKALDQLEPDNGTDMPDDPREAALYEDWKNRRQLFDPEQADAHFEKVYTDPEYFKNLESSSLVQEAAKVNHAPEQVAIGAANRSFIAHTLGRSSDSMNGDYEFYRDGYAQKFFAKPTVSEGEFFNLVKGQMQTRQKAREAVSQIPMDIVSSIFEDIDKGTTRTSAELVQNWKTQHADIFRPEYEHPLLAAVQQRFNEDNDWIRKYAPQAKVIYEGLAQQTGVKPRQEGGPDVNQIADALLSMPREDRFKAYEVASLYAAKTGDAKGFFKQLGESLSRGVTETTGQVDMMAQEQALQAQIHGLNNPSNNNVERTPSYQPYSSQANTPEERAKLATEAQNQLDRLTIVRELNQLATGQIDPIKNIAKGLWGDVEGGLYSAANSLPLMAGIAIPYVGVPASIMAYTGQEYDRMRLKYPDLPRDQVQTMSLVSGGVQAALDKLQVEAVFGKLPVTGKLLEEFAKPGRAWLPRVALASGLNFTEQMGQEMAQNATPMLVDASAKALGADMPQFNWDEQLKDLKDSVPQTFFALLPYVLLGAGGISVRELKRGEQFRTDSIALQNLGFSTKVADNLANQPTPEKFDAEFQQAWQELPGSKKRKLIKRTDGTMKVAQELNDSAFTPDFKKVGNLYSVKDVNGKEIINTPDEQAALTAYREALDTARESNRLNVQNMISFYEEQAANQGRDVKFETVAAPKSVQDVISAGEASMEQMRDRMRIEGISADPTDVSILGETTVDQLRDGVYQTTIKLFHGATPDTVVEENIEGFTREAIAKGHVTMDFLRSQVEAYQQVSGESLLTGTNQSVIEAVSTLGKAYFAGKLKERQLPGTLQKFFSQLAIYFKEIFGRALKLKQAFSEGKLSSDFESLLAESVGIPVEQQIANERVKNQGQLLEGSTFSIQSNTMPKENRAAENTGQPSPGGRVAEAIKTYLEDYSTNREKAILSGPYWHVDTWSYKSDSNYTNYINAAGETLDIRISNHAKPDHHPTAKDFEFSYVGDKRSGLKWLREEINKSGLNLKTPEDVQRRLGELEAEHADKLRSFGSVEEINSKLEKAREQFSKKPKDAVYFTDKISKLEEALAFAKKERQSDVFPKGKSEPTGAYQSRLLQEQSRSDTVLRPDLSQSQSGKEVNPEVDKATGLPLNQDGTVTLYHGTTKEVASQIRKTGTIKSAAEPDVYFTTAQDGTGYGDGTVIALKLNPHQLILDDEFPNGRKDFRIEVGKSKQLKVQIAPESRAPSDGATYSIATKEQQDRINKALEKLNKAPAERLRIYENASRRLNRLLTENRDIIDAMRQEGASRIELSRTKLIQSIGELDAVLSVLPYDIRGKIGGFTTLSKIGTGEKALGNFFVNRIEMIGRELERTLKKEYDSRLQKLFDRAKPLKDEAGKKRIGKAGADVHALFDTLRQAVDWSPQEADAYVAGLENKINSGDLTPEEEAHTALEVGLVPLVADWKNADSARRATAVDNATRIFEKGYYEFKNKKFIEADRRQAIRSRLQEDTGKIGDKNERDARMLADNKFSGKWKDSLLSMLNFEQAMHWTFGQDSKEAARIVDMERKAAYQKDDALREKTDALEELFTKLAGSRYKGEQLRWDMSQKSIEAGGIKLSELEAITATLMWRQEDGRRHMEGNFDENGRPISSWNYDQKFIDDIESQLSDNAREVRNFLSDEYAQEYEPLNKVYRALNGVDLPQNKNYAPITVVPKQAQGSQSVDPVTGNTFSAGSTTPGSLRTRGTSTAEPDFKDALQVYIAHTKQMEHWKAYAPLVNEAGALLRNRELGNSIQAKSGDQGLKVLRGWLDLFAQGGTRDAAAHLAINKFISNMSSRAASVALVGRLGTLAVQSTQLGAAMAEMPIGSYLVRLGKLFSGQLKWKEAFNSDYIQRRLGEMPPIVRQAVEGLKSEKPNLLRHTVAKLGSLIGGTDALFTAGTYAMVYDYQLSQAKNLGLSGEEAQAYANDKADKAVDRLAQPTRAGARSLFENTSTNPFTRLAWAFASESRKNLMLAAYALAKRPVAEKLRATAFVFLIEGAISSIIRNAWRDARDNKDDEFFDERNWDLKRLALSTITSPMQGVPVLGDMVQAGAFKMAGEYLPEGNLLSLGDKEVKAIMRADQLVTGQLETDQALKDAEAMLTFAGRFNSDIAATASLSHLAKDLFGVTENLTTEHQ